MRISAYGSARDQPISISLSLYSHCLSVYLSSHKYIPEKPSDFSSKFFRAIFYEHSDEKIVHEKNNGNMNDNLVQEKLIEY